MITVSITVLFGLIDYCYFAILATMLSMLGIPNSLGMLSKNRGLGINALLYCYYSYYSSQNGYGSRHCSDVSPQLLTSVLVRKETQHSISATIAP